VGNVSVLSCAPYGYRYVSTWESGAEARFEIVLEEARVVRQIFEWVGRDRWSIGEVQRRLNAAKEQTRTGKTVWDRATIWGILKNPAYKGTAADRAKRQWNRCAHGYEHNEDAVCNRKKRLRQRHVPADQWLRIPVPPIVDAALFDTIAEQLEENRQRARASKRGARYLLQGLLVWARYAGMRIQANRLVQARVNSMSVPTPIIVASAQMPIA
jgi:site-specific DNA recombinase